MPRSASTGVYTAPSNSFNPAVTNTTIGSAAWNATQADYVTALAHTASTTRALYPTAGQVQDGGFLWGGTAGGTADALTITLTPAITAYATGQVFQFIAASTNVTTAPTINVNGVGVRTIKRQAGTALQASDISAGAVVQAAVVEVCLVLERLHLVANRVCHSHLIIMSDMAVVAAVLPP